MVKVFIGRIEGSKRWFLIIYVGGSAMLGHNLCGTEEQAQDIFKSWLTSHLDMIDCVANA